LYRWQWQTARLLKQLGETDEAIAAYRRAVYTLQSIRQEMEFCVGNSLSQYRKVAGSICFELVDLLLKQAKLEKNTEERLALLMEARDIVELLRVYELRNYFKDDCVDAARENRVQLDALCRTTAVVYPIVLKDRTELLVSLPAGLKQFTLSVNNETLIREVRSFRRLLEKRTTREFLPHARKLYDYLIRPLEADLTSQKVDTLVFVPGGALRTIPLAALYDGKQFLVNSYATAVTPGLNLTDPSPINREKIQVMIAGVTQATQGYPPLPYVRDELQAIARICPSITMIDKDFVVAKFKESLQREQFNIIHIASHGQFQSDVDRTFILTFDSKLTMSTLDEYIGFLRFRQEPLDLLTLSACETAAGDDLAALGLAGVAVRAGARSALATLWHINDAATSVLIEEFYRQIQKPSVSRAVALQKAQLKILQDSRYSHPAYWSAFLLINNWL
jgi:CHAT domain-containing protein